MKFLMCLLMVASVSCEKKGGGGDAAIAPAASLDARLSTAATWTTNYSVGSTNWTEELTFTGDQLTVYMIGDAPGVTVGPYHHVFTLTPTSAVKATGVNNADATTTLIEYDFSGTNMILCFDGDCDTYHP